MRLVCPLCRVAYSIDERRLPPGGANVRCPKCRGVFPLVPASSPGAAQPFVAVAPARVDAPIPAVSAATTLSGAPARPPSTDAPPVRSQPAASEEEEPPPPWDEPAVAIPAPPPDARAKLIPTAPAAIEIPPPVVPPSRPPVMAAPAAASPEPAAAAAPPAPPDEWLDFDFERALDAPPPAPAAVTEPPPSPREAIVPAPPSHTGLEFGEVDLSGANAPPVTSPDRDALSAAAAGGTAQDGFVLGDVEPFPFESSQVSTTARAVEPSAVAADEPLAFGDRALDLGSPVSGPAAVEPPVEPIRDPVTSAPGAYAHPEPNLDEPAPLPARRTPPSVAAGTNPDRAEPPAEDHLEELFDGPGSDAATVAATMDAGAAPTRQLDPPVAPATAKVPAPPLGRAEAPRTRPSKTRGATPWWRRKLVMTIGVAAAVVVLAGVAATWTPYGPFFHRALRGHVGANRPGARFLAEARQRLAEDRFTSVKAAVELADRALRLDGRDPEAQAVYTYAVSLLARRHGAATAAWTRARAFLPELGKRGGDDPDAAKALVGAALLTGDASSAAPAAFLEKVAAKQGPVDRDALLVLGDAALLRGDPARAATWYQRLQAAEPGSVRADHGLGVAAARRGDAPAARRLLEGAIARDPGHVGTLVELASLSLATGETERAGTLAHQVLADARAEVAPRDRAHARMITGLLLARSIDDHVEASLGAAERELESALQEDAEDPEARFALAEFLLDRGAVDRAVATLTPIQPGLRDARVLGLQARLLGAQGKAADAAALLDAALSRSPGDARLLYARGVVANEAGKQGDADRFWTEAVQRDPAAFEPHLALGQARLARGDLEGADRELKLAAERAPASAAVRCASADLLVARHQLEAAKAAYDAALALDRSHGPAYLGLARVALEGRDPVSARSYLQRAVAIAPRLQQAQALYGELLWKAGDLGTARKAFERAVALDPRDSTSLARLGAIELQQGDRDAAVVHLRDASNLAVPTPEVRAWYGRALLAKGEPQAAVEQLKKSVELDGKNALVFLQLGQAQERLANATDAAHAYRTAQELAPQLVEAYEALGVLYAGQNRCAEALPQLERASALARTDNRIRVVLADCKAKLGRHAEAVALYRRVLQADPSQVALYYKIARAQHEATGVRDAMPWYEQAAQHEPENAMSHYYMAFAHKERGRPAKAIAEFREYLRISPNALDRKDIEREIEDLAGAAEPDRP